MIPAKLPKLPKLPWFLQRGAHPGSQAQRSDCPEVWWPASPAQPLLPLHHHILVLLLLQALVVPTPTAHTRML